VVTHPARAARHRAPGRHWAALFFFLAAVLAFATTAGNTAAAAVSTTETRVGVSAPATITAVGLPADIAAGQHPVRAGPQQDLAQARVFTPTTCWERAQLVRVQQSWSTTQTPDAAAMSSFRRLT
jgi:hypothetical protein